MGCTNHSRSTILNSMMKQEIVNLDIETDSQSDSSEVSEDGSMEDGGAYAFSRLQRNAEIQRLNPAAGVSKNHQRKYFLSNLQECFSLSSLEIDLNGSDLLSDDDENDDQLDRAVSRFSARSSPRGSMDFVPLLPTSSDRPHQLDDLRRMVSPSSRVDDTRWHSESAFPPRSSHRAMEGEKVRCEEFCQTPSWSRWSSGSDRSLQQDALCSHGEEKGGEGQTFTLAGFDKAIPAPSMRRRSMDSLFEREQRSKCTRSAPVPPRRGSEPMDRMCEMTRNLTRQDSFRAPMKFLG